MSPGGDHRDNDVAGALNAGLSAVWYAPDPPSVDTMPDPAPLDSALYRVITRLTEITELIAALDGR